MGQYSPKRDETRKGKGKTSIDPPPKWQDPGPPIVEWPEEAPKQQEQQQ